LFPYIWWFKYDKNALFQILIAQHTAIAPSRSLGTYSVNGVSSLSVGSETFTCLYSFLAGELEPAGRQGCHQQHAVSHWDLSRVRFSTSLAHPHWTRDISNTPPDPNRRGRETPFYPLLIHISAPMPSAAPINFLLRFKFA